ncbi:MAG TPA: lysophospholipid acyltransferase family protein [Anaeromyxobacter sp.]
MRLLGWLFARLPYRWTAAFGAALGWLLWALRIRRRVVLDNLKLALPERSDAERHEIARRTFLSLGQMLVDFLRVPYLRPAELDQLFVTEGWERYEQAASRGTGVVACTAHFGNFEALAAAHTLRGVPITTISRQMADNRINAAWRAFRNKSGVEEIVVARNATFKAAIRALKARRVLGYVIDQNEVSRSAVFPTFFGVPAATSPTPAVLALRTGAAVVFVVSYPLGDGRHRVVIEGPLDVRDTGDRDRDVLAFMQDLNDRLERWIREHPEQWYWLHRRWKTRPPGVN